MKNTYDSLKKVSEDLHLEFELQDWGIINSDADRIEEFIQYFDQHASIPDSTKYVLYELIIASFNDSISEGKATADIFDRLHEFVEKTAFDELYSEILNYWKNLPDNDEFKIQKFLP